MSSHHKHHKPSHKSKQYEYKVISSHTLKKKDQKSVEEYLNTFGSDGWDLATIEIKGAETKGISFLGVMKRKHPRGHNRH